MLTAGRGSAEPVLRHMRTGNHVQLHGPQGQTFTNGAFASRLPRGDVGKYRSGTQAWRGSPPARGLGARTRRCAGGADGGGKPGDVIPQGGASRTALAAAKVPVIAQLARRPPGRSQGVAQG